MPDAKISKKSNLSCFFKSETSKLKVIKEEGPGPGQYSHTNESIKKKQKNVGFDTTEDKNKMMNKKGCIITTSELIDIGPGL